LSGFVEDPLIGRDPAPGAGGVEAGEGGRVEGAEERDAREGGEGHSYQIEISPVITLPMSMIGL
jgi:hypothetical protein